MNRNTRLENDYAVTLRNKGYNVVANLAHFDYDNWVYAYESRRFFKKTKEAIIEAARKKGFDCVLVGFERATRSQDTSEMYCITLKVYDTNDKHELVCDGKCEKRPYRIIGVQKTVRTVVGTTTQTPIEYTETMLETRDKALNYIISQF